MGRVNKPEKVKLIAAILFSSENDYSLAIDLLVTNYGEIDYRSEIFPFTFSDYYEPAMGSGLKKQFLSFKKLTASTELPEIKIFTNSIEQKLLSDGNRTVNIDPGYIEESKLILATTKNYSHRIHLQKGIYGDIHLVWQDKQYITMPWTYPDYKQKLSLAFFTSVRKDYMKAKSETVSATYKDSGVDIDHGDEAIYNIKKDIKSTFDENVLVEVGKFGGFYKIDKSKYDDPVLVSSVDGVGTKLMIATEMNKHNTVGEDLVNHCVNDILCCGAEPLYFLDYFGAGRLEVHVHNEVLKGFITGCRNNGCALIGGETAEMPDVYKPGDYDLCGCIVGIVEKNNILDGSKINKGDVLIGIPSNGFHTNGYSLVRKVFFDRNDYSVSYKFDELEFSLGEELLRVHRSYKVLLLPLIKDNKLSGLSHITGGGIEGNTKRLLADGLSLNINWKSWEVPPLFNIVQRLGNIDTAEMRRVFNMGIGIIMIVRKENVDHVMNFIENSNEKCFILGEVI